MGLLGEEGGPELVLGAGPQGTRRERLRRDPNFPSPGWWWKWWPNARFSLLKTQAGRETMSGRRKRVRGHRCQHSGSCTPCLTGWAGRGENEADMGRAEAGRMARR